MLMAVSGTWKRLFGVGVFALAWSAAPVSIRASEAGGSPAYIAVRLETDGGARAESLDGLAAAARSAAAPGAQLVVMVHGFETGFQEGRRDYTQAAERLRTQSNAIGLPLIIVGVHWASDPGTRYEWVPRAAAHRLTSLLGLKKAVRNPYLEKSELARRTGHAGLRAVLFRLRDEFPGAPLQLLTHSMGATLLVSALAPGPAAAGGPEIEQPERTLTVDLAALAGADLDYDLFARKSDKDIRRALDRARVWWVTTPAPKSADGVLELRRAAGRPDAVGNRGMKLERAELHSLLSRRALVVDQGNVPVRHHIGDYYNARRLQALAAAMLYLERPAMSAARDSVLARLDDLLQCDQSALGPRAGSSDASTRLYAGWRLSTAGGSEIPIGAVAAGDSSTHKVLGDRQSSRP